MLRDREACDREQRLRDRDQGAHKREQRLRDRDHEAHDGRWTEDGAQVLWGVNDVPGCVRDRDVAAFIRALEFQGPRA